MTKTAADGLSARSIRKYHTMLHSIFKRAVRDQLIVTNPCEHTELPKIISKKSRTLTPAEYDTLIAAIPDRYRLLVETAIETGMRWGELIALRIEGRNSLQVAMVRWFRNTMKASGLEFGCELLSDNPEAAAAASEDAKAGALQPVVVLPEDRGGGPDASPPQIIVPAGVFALEQAIALKRGSETGYAVLTKLVEQGPGFELYEFISVA